MDTKALRQKILDLAIRGKLVPQDPNDEPASVLLERIREQKQQMVKDGKLKKKDIKNDSVIFVGEDNLHYEKFANGGVKCIEDEIPFELPEGWAWARLGTVAEAIGDGDHQPPPQTSSGIPFLVISNVSGGALSFKNTRFVSIEYFNRLPETRKPQNGDLLFTVTGSYGIPVLVDTDDMFCFQRHIAIVRPCTISNRYLYVILGSSYVESICDAKATGTAQKTVGLATLRELLIPIAPHTEQMQIYVKTQNALSIVDSISSDKEALLNIIKNTKAKILDLAIRGKLVPQNPDDEPASVLLERIRAEKEDLIKQGKIKRNKRKSIIFKGEDNSYYEKIGSEVRCIDSEIPFDLPKSWMFARLKHIGEVIGGGTPKTNVNEYWDGNIPWLTPADLSGYEDVYILTGARTITELGLKSSSAQVLPKNSILYSSRAPIGYIAIAANPISTNQGFKSVVPYDFAMGPYLYYCLKARTSDIVQRATGTTFKEISGSEMAKTIIPLPPINEQQRIFDKVTQLLEALSTIEKSLN